MKVDLLVVSATSFMRMREPCCSYVTHIRLSSVDALPFLCFSSCVELPVLKLVVEFIVYVCIYVIYCISRR
jgi:hypothetical protein